MSRRTERVDLDEFRPRLRAGRLPEPLLVTFEPRASDVAATFDTIRQHEHRRRTSSTWRAAS